MSGLLNPQTSSPRIPSRRAVKVFDSRNFDSNEPVEHIARIKEQAALLWDELESIPISGESARLIALAKTDLESAALWAVKAVSRVAIDS